MDGATALFAGGSLLVAFLGGMVMLFAPCCVTFMLPAYLGTVFKSRFKVLLLTGVFATGIATVILPIVLGARFVTSFLSANHTYVFTAGSLLMIGIGFMTLYNKRLRLPFVSKLKAPQANDVASAYGLGVVSGASSACCAPVVLGALTLAALSPTWWHATAIGLSYTLGIVFPLFVMAVIAKKGVPKLFLAVQQKKLHFGNLHVSLANFIAFLILTGAGLVLLLLTLTGRNNVSMVSADLTVGLKTDIDKLQSVVQDMPLVEIVFSLLVVGFFIYVFYLVRRENTPPSQHDEKDGKQEI